VTETININRRWSTICTVGYTGSVSRNENRSAHGGVCLVQVRLDSRGKTIARKVNSNGRHHEIGEPFEPTNEQIEYWLKIEASAR